MAKKPQHVAAQKLPIKESAFGICMIPPNKSLLSKPSVLLVNNISDKKNSEVLAQNRDLVIDGKREGWGLPGGGVQDDNYEQSYDAVEREFTGETGLKVLSHVSLEGYIDINKVLVVRKKTRTKAEKLTWQSQYKAGQRPRVPAFDSSRFYAIENPFPLFTVKAQWDGSTLQKEMIGLKKHLISSKAQTQAEINTTGLYFNFDEIENLDPKKDLGIDEAHEIKGIGLFTIQWVLDLLEKNREEHDIYMEKKIVWENLQEPGRHEVTSKPTPPISDIYYIHMCAIEQAHKLKLLSVA